MGINVVGKIIWKFYVSYIMITISTCFVFSFSFFGREQMFVDCNKGFIDPPHCNLDFAYTLFVLVENITFSITLLIVTSLFLPTLLSLVVNCRLRGKLLCLLNCILN